MRCVCVRPYTERETQLNVQKEKHERWGEKCFAAVLYLLVPCVLHCTLFKPLPLISLLTSILKLVSYYS